jgi:predicted amidohydrolase
MKPGKPSLEQAELPHCSALQMVSGPRVADNLLIAGQLIETAVAQGAQMVALPEYFPIIGAADADRVRAREDFGHGPIQDWLAETAQRYGIWIFAGSLPLTAADPEKMRNTSLVYNPAGECVKRYDKIHLFGFKKGR